MTDTAQVRIRKDPTTARWIDNSGNSWDGQLFQTVALERASSLKKCIGCVDCQDCDGCTACMDCLRCSDCSLCYTCTDCNNCMSCHQTEECATCCNCSNCHYCRHAENSSMCVDCSLVKESHNCAGIHGTLEQGICHGFHDAIGASGHPVLSLQLDGGCRLLVDSQGEVHLDNVPKSMEGLSLVFLDAVKRLKGLKDGKEQKR